MKFLILAQDLRLSGTSEGIVSRSFLGKLRQIYPEAIIDVVYLKQYDSQDELHLLPVDSIETHVLNLKIPFITKWLNKIYWRIFHVSLKEEYIHNVYSSKISKVDYKKYDHIFIRSAGLEHEIILGCHNLPILKNAIVNFHDPYPLFWYPGSRTKLTNLEMFRMKKMEEVVSQAKTCCSSAHYMSNDLQFLYDAHKKFYTLPHQYVKDVFNLSDTNEVRSKQKKVTISYHGSLMFGRNVEVLLDAYKSLIEENLNFKENTEFVLRMKGDGVNAIKAKFSNDSNIIILDTLNFSNSSNEQINIADINIILENGPIYCNILVGKAAFLAATCKPVLTLSPERSELRNVILDEKYIAGHSNKEEIKNKLEYLINNRLISNKLVYPFGDYFSDDNFKTSLNKILNNS
ncbi:hypothetical protein ACFSX9_13690 [Flavobacterium ardleyense]|uniref:Uncharacterized protein n=1 Tax=Flavobacterium ardleyense TaxID=2038737 RepID=A0ABW5ZC04_9FLAO